MQYFLQHCKTEFHHNLSFSLDRYNSTIFRLMLALRLPRWCFLNAVLEQLTTQPAHNIKKTLYGGWCEVKTLKQRRNNVMFWRPVPAGSTNLIRRWMRKSISRLYTECWNYAMRLIKLNRSEEHLSVISTS